MNSGFSNFDFLKKQLLAGTLASDKRFDTLIQTIGLGVAGQFEQLCNRKFCRAVNTQQTLPADRSQFSLARYPIETVTTYELNQADGQGFQVQNLTNILSIDQVAGLAYFTDTADLGKYYHQVRFTYTGGYWWNTLEPDDPAFPEPLPVGAASLPPEILHAWILQCRAVWAALDKTGENLLKQGLDKSAGALPALNLVPDVKSTLSQFTRYSLV